MACTTANIAESLLAKGADSAAAVLHRDRLITYGELRREVLQIAGQLLADGHVKGDRVALCVENSPFFVAAYLGTIRAGLVSVPIQTEATAERFKAIMTNTGARSVFVSERLQGRVRPWAQELGVILLTESYARGSPAAAAPSFPEAEPTRDLAALMFTSGSTGSPKGVMVTHRNIECNTRDIIQYLGLVPDDRVMVVLPFHYCFGLSLMHTHLMAGASLVLNNDFRLFPETMLLEMRRRECTGLAGVPSTYQILLRRSRFRELAFPHLRWLQQAGGRLPSPCIREIQAAFPGVRFFAMYGQTEATARLSYLPPERLADRLGSIGKGLPSTELAVLHSDGTPIQPGSDELGEVVAAGDNITPGYWNDSTETAAFFRNGKLHTGDIARVDSDGFIYLVDRARDMIKSGGHRVSAQEVEDVLAELPGVLEVAVVGAPHEELGEASYAFVVPTPGACLTAREVKAHCRKRLPAFMVPEEVAFLKDLVHNSAGKVLKQELRRLALVHSALVMPSSFGLRHSSFSLGPRVLPRGPTVPARTQAAPSPPRAKPFPSRRKPV